MAAHHLLTDVGRRAVAAIAAAPEQTLLVLDYDGTLAPIVADPDAARPDEAALAAVGRLGRRLGQVAVLSGRELGSLRRLGGFAGRDGFDRLVLLGQYGHERFDAATGAETSPPPSPVIVELAGQLPDLLAAAGLAEVTLEDKRHSVSLHTRTAADPAATLARLAPWAEALARQRGLTVQPGRFVVELRGAHVDKGDALRTLVRESGARIVVFAGDDLGDVPAFSELARLREEGLFAVGVCSASAEESALLPWADVVCDGPAGVGAWLGEVADEIEQGHHSVG